MPCPHFSVRENDCLLLDREPPVAAEAPAEVVVAPDRLPPHLCRSSNHYQGCPVFRRRAVELRRAN